MKITDRQDGALVPLAVYSSPQTGSLSAFWVKWNCGGHYTKDFTGISYKSDDSFIHIKFSGVCTSSILTVFDWDALWVILFLTSPIFFVHFFFPLNPSLVLFSLGLNLRRVQTAVCFDGTVVGSTAPPHWFLVQVFLFLKVWMSVEEK